MANHQKDQSGEILTAARNILVSAPSYARWFSEVSLEYDDGVLTLHGALPSFYAKQVLQTRLRNVAGVTSVNNQTRVVNSVTRHG